MKNIKLFAITVITFILFAMLFSCGGNAACSECSDNDGNGICDVCNKEIKDGSEEDAEAVELIKNGETAFQIVLPKNASNAVRQAVNTGIKAVLRNAHNIDVDVVYEGEESDVPIDCEILIGNIKSRGDDYYYDGHNLGKEGYAFRIVGKKVLISAGSDEKLANAVEKFAKNILIPDDPTNVTMTSDDVVLKPQANYKITALKVNGTDMKGYTLATDLAREGYSEAALNIQDTIYTRTGYWFEIVELDNANEKSIVISNIPKTEGKESFKVFVKGSQLVIECAYDNMLERATNRFITDNITLGKGDVNFKDTVYTQDISVVYYEDFGAKGDGKTDDFEAIFKTHEFANVSGQTVKANPDATYYIQNTYFGSKKHTAKIQTNVDWQGAKFIIDDSRITKNSDSNNYYKNMNSYIFAVALDDALGMVKITDRTTLAELNASGIKRGTENIPLKLEGWDGPLMIIPYNSSHKIARRKGYSGYDGSIMQEVILLDEHGNVDKETPVVFDFQDFDYIEVYKLDPSTAITVENGVFTTLSCTVNDIEINEDASTTVGNTNLTRGLAIQRSYTTVRCVEHYITGQMPLIEQVDDNGNIIACGVRYSGFFSISNVTDILLEDCVVTGKRCYKKPVGGTEGTLDMHANRTNNLLCKGCTQSNFWVTVDEDTYEIKAVTKDTPGAVTSMSNVTVNGTSLKMHWGIMSSNYCKNVEYRDSTLSRFDAHIPIYNGKIVNCTINYIELTGSGTFTLEDTTWYSANPSRGANAVIPLRADYGSSWNGEIKIKNVKAHVYTEGPNYAGVFLLYHTYNNWYYGYTTAFPSMLVDNLDFYNIKTGEALPANFQIQLDSSVSSNQKMHLPLSHTHAMLCVTDNDKDGYLDEPSLDYDRDGKIEKTDIDGNGIFGNSAIKYDAAIASLNGDYDSGYALTDVFFNQNQVIPPKYIKIINNDGVDGTGGYVYAITDTSGMGISDGKYWNTTKDSFGGFFGYTTFIFGEDDGDYFIGTGKDKNQKSKTFKFV